MTSKKTIFCLLFLFHNCYAQDSQTDLIHEERSGVFKINETSFEEVFPLKKNIIDPLGATLRIEAEVGKDATGKCPVIFIIQVGENIQSFSLPKNMSYDEGGASFLHFTAGRTICFDPFETPETDQKVRVTVSTCGPTGVQYHFKLTGSSSSYIQKENPMSTIVSPNSPAYFPYKFDSRRGKDIMLVEVRSPDNICMIVSVQSPQCPVADQEDTVNFNGKSRNYWQTMSTVSLMPITREDFPRGFELVFVVNTDNTRCKQYRGLNASPSEFSNQSFGQTMDPKLKNITFIINEELPHGEYIYPVFVPIAFYFALIGLVLFLFTIFYQCQVFFLKRRRPEPPFRVEFTNTLDPARLSVDVDAQSIRSRASIDSSTSSNESHFSHTPIEDADQIRILRSRYNPDNSRANRAGHPPCVTDLVYAPDKHVETSRRYYWLMFTIAIFYSVPVFQLLATYEQILLKTGDNDLCYYNYHCAHPFWKLVDFNHIYSNIGYVLLGTFFIFLVYFKERLHQQVIENLRLAHLNSLAPSPSTSAPVVHQPMERHGTIQHFGIYYSLGFALIMEGILSAGYHVCPNRSNFQFDTSFMYVIAVLYMVKIYQFRHPVRINASTTFALLAVIAVISVLGLLVAQLTVAIIFSIVHMVAVFYIQIYMYYVGHITEDDGTLVTDRTRLVKIVLAKWKHMYSTERFIMWLKPSHPARILLPILSVPFNFAVMIVHFTIQNNFATHLLYIFIGNLLLYLTYYIVMKMLYLEFIRLKSIQPLIYIPLTVILWVYAVQYFNKVLTSWEKSPAESRQENEECFLMEFYDFHDMWHFLSAGALFCSFMMLLTLEDALEETPQRDIPVF